MSSPYFVRYSCLALSACSSARIERYKTASISCHSSPTTKAEGISGTLASREANSAECRQLIAELAISVTVAPETSAFAIRGRRPSRRSSAVDGAAGSMHAFEVFVFSRLPIGTGRRGYVPLNSSPGEPVQNLWLAAARFSPKCAPIDTSGEHRFIRILNILCKKA
jgi:hypothetical protein